MPSTADMLVDLVDAHDRPLHAVRRAVVRVPGAGFRVVHVLLLDLQGRLLLQQIAAPHERHPYWWGSSVAGYVGAGESYEQAAARKLGQEAGLRGVKLRRLGMTTMSDAGARKFIAVFAAAIEPHHLRLNPMDFASSQLVPLDLVAKEVEEGARHFTPTFVHVFRFAEPLLAPSVV